MTSGIYQILNTVTNKRYIGSSSDLYKRQWTHKKNLKSGRHPNPYLQSSWNKYGEESFTIETILVCEVNNLLMYEDLIIKHYKSNQKEFGYNLREVVENNIGVTKYQSGQIYNRLTLLQRDVGSKWLCRCSCGTEKIIDVFSLKANRIKSCGCLNKELASTLMVKQHNDPEWSKRQRVRAKVTMIKTMSRPENRILASEHAKRLNKEKLTKNG